MCLPMGLYLVIIQFIPKQRNDITPSMEIICFLFGFGLIILLNVVVIFSSAIFFSELDWRFNAWLCGVPEAA